MPPPRLVASTSFSNHFFKSATWTPDGTSLLTNSDDNTIRTYVLPPTLLTTSAPHTLTPYTILSLPTPVTTLAIYPHHTLSDANTTLYLASLRDHPLRLQNTLHTQLVASYPLVHAPTERYISPASLLFTPDGRHFLAGADGLLASFDLSRNGEGPVTERKTNASARGRKGDVVTGMGMKGIVSAMSLNTEGILAAGTFTRNIALYASSGQGEQIAVFPLTQMNIGKEDDSFVGGSGVTDVRWSPCGRYLYVAERQSSGVHVYDVRVAGRRVGVLRGRRAETTQRVGVDVVVADVKVARYQHEEGGDCAAGSAETERDDLEAARQRALSLAATQEDSYDLETPRYEDDNDTPDRSWRNARASPVYDTYVDESQPLSDLTPTLPNNHIIISGGTDGIVRTWTNPHFVDGVLDPDDDSNGVGSAWKASIDTLASVVSHPRMGTSVLATCSGSRHFAYEGEESGSDSDAEGVEEGAEGVVQVQGGARRKEESQRQRDYSLKVWAFD